MPFLICPECGEHNPTDAAFCQACQASLEGVMPFEEPASQEPEEIGFGPLETGDDDLPDFLESLRQEDLPPDDEDLPAFELSGDSGETPQQEEPHEAPTPEWLDVVRKRAQEEEDAVGELSKRISDAQENLKQEKRESQHEDFESWIQKLRDEARDKAAGAPALQAEEAEPEEEVVDEDEPKWLSRIRKTHGIPDEEEHETDAAGRSLLEWLVALEEEQTAEEPTREAEVTQQVTLPPESHETDATREIRISAARGGEPQSTLDLTREDREQADQLVATIADETADRPVEARRHWKPLRILNVFFALVLFVGIGFMLLTGRVVSFTDPVLPQAGYAVLDWAAGLPEDANVLFVFDYQAAYSAEMEWIAAPVLSEVVKAIDSVDVISTSPAGMLLSADLLAAYPALAVSDLGYIPGEAYAAFGLAGSTLDAGAYTDVLVLSDQFESAQGWVEQWTLLAPESLMNMLVTAQAGPLLLPYVEAGQVKGMVSGLTQAVAMEAALGQKGPATAAWQAYQVGVLVMIGALVLGGIAGVGDRRFVNERGGR
jgi:hypothetical protein